MAFDLLLLRHAHAEAVGGAIGSDADRPISPSGQAQSAVLGRALGSLDLCPRLIVSSPLIRAVQTARAVADALQPFACAPRLEICSELEPGASPPDLLRRIQLEGASPVLLVGHQPDVGRLLSFLVSGGSMEMQFQFDPATVAIVQVDELPLTAPGRLLALMPPRIQDRIHNRPFPGG
jgi:phosphohistidine phosphatase